MVEQNTHGAGRLTHVYFRLSAAFANGHDEILNALDEACWAQVEDNFDY